jgi:hypothetical protein
MCKMSIKDEINFPIVSYPFVCININIFNFMSHIWRHLCSDPQTLEDMWTICFLYQLKIVFDEYCELINKNDIVCLQETKTDDIDKIDLEGYTFKMKNRKKIGRKSGELRSFLTVQFKLSSALLLLHELELCGENWSSINSILPLHIFDLLFWLSLKNWKQFGRKSGGIILGYKDHLENYIEPLETESNYISCMLINENFNKIGVFCSSTVKIPKQTDIFVILR